MLEEALSWERLDRLASSVMKSFSIPPAALVSFSSRPTSVWFYMHWRQPKRVEAAQVPDLLKGLLRKVHGIDLEQGAIELAAFSLCLALCDSLEPLEVFAPALNFFRHWREESLAPCLLLRNAKEKATH